MVQINRSAVAGLEVNGLAAQSIKPPPGRHALRRLLVTHFRQDSPSSGESSGGHDDVNIRERSQDDPTLDRRYPWTLGDNAVDTLIRQRIDRLRRAPQHKDGMS
jgi:hypothetical protein